MSETPNGLRGEMAAACFDPGAYVGPRGARTTDQWRADACIAGPLAPFLAQVSVLQAEVEAARALNRDLHRRAQKAESFRARHGNTYGVKARWAGRQALRKALAEVERLQKVEGEREKGRVPDGTGLSPDGQTASRSDPSDFDPSRDTLLEEILSPSQVQDLNDRLLGAYVAPYGGLRLDNAEVAYLWAKIGGQL